MSLERKIPEVARTSHGFAKGESRRLAEARRTDPTAERINRLAIPTRANILSTIDARTRNNKELNDLMYDEPHLKTLTEFIDARIGVANGDREKFEKFVQRADPGSETFDPEFSRQVDSLNTHFHIALSCFPKKRS